MTKIFRVLVQVEELMDNEFKRIISLEKTTNHKTGVIKAISEYFQQTINFINRLSEDK